MTIIDGKGRVIVSPLATGEISILVDCGRGTMGALLDRKQAVQLRRALFNAIYGSPDRVTDTGPA